MKLLNHSNGNIIAHWTRKPTADDIAAYIQYTREAVFACGLDAKIEPLPIEPDNNCWSLGHNTLSVRITLNHPVNNRRNRYDGSVIDGLSTITIKFGRKAGLFDFGEATKRNEEQFKAFETLPLADAYKAVDAMKWDGEILDFYAVTNGRIRGYRCRNWYRYQGGKHAAHFAYGDFNDIREAIKSYIVQISLDIDAYYPNVRNAA